MFPDCWCSEADLCCPAQPSGCRVWCNDICKYNTTCPYLSLHNHTLSTQEYTDDIIELLVNEYLSPQQVCDALSLCPWNICLSFNIKLLQTINILKQIIDLIYVQWHECDSWPLLTLTIFFSLLHALLFIHFGRTQEADFYCHQYLYSTRL